MDKQKLEASIAATYGLSGCTDYPGKAFELVALIGQTTLSDCCDNWFLLRRQRSCLNGQVEKHVWQARFFGVKRWAEDEDLPVAICKAVCKLERFQKAIGRVLFFDYGRIADELASFIYEHRGLEPDRQEKANSVCLGGLDEEDPVLFQCPNCGAAHLDWLGPQDLAAGLGPGERLCMRRHKTCNAPEIKKVGGGEKRANEAEPRRG